MSPSQPQAHQHALRVHTMAQWQLGPTSETATTAAQQALLLCQGEDKLVGLCYIYCIIASPQRVNVVSPQVQCHLAHAKDALLTMPAGVIQLS